MLDDARARLLASAKFDGIEVLKRYASITDPSRILVMIIVTERPARIHPADRMLNGCVPLTERRSFIDGFSVRTREPLSAFTTIF